MTRRTLMIVGGTAVVLFSLALIVTSIRSSSSILLALAGGLGLAAGATSLGIGLGHWSHPRLTHSEADYTGAGTVKDAAVPPRVV